MRNLSCFLGLASLVGCTRASDAPAPGPESGLLLGLSSGRTMLFASVQGHYALVADRQPLLVSRDDGLYWVGNVSRCSVDTVEQDRSGAREWVSRREQVYVVRGGDSVVVMLPGDDCRQTELLVRQLRSRGDSVPSDSNRIQASMENGSQLYCSVDTREVTFVSANVLSYQARSRATEFCNPSTYAAVGSNVVRQLTSNERLSLHAMLPPPAWEHVRAVLRDSASDCTADQGTPEAQMDSTWSITRGRGAWKVQYWIDGPVGCRGGRDWDFDDLTLDSLTHELKLPLPWDSLRIQLPRTEDASSSPSGKLLVLRRPDSVSIAPFVAGKVGPSLGGAPVEAPERFVMLRWLDATELERLRSSIAAVKDPIVVVRRASP